MDITHNLKKITTGGAGVGGRRGGQFGAGHRHRPGRPSVPRPIPVVPRATVAGNERCLGPGINVRIPATHVVWDNSVCHTYWQTPYGRGNVRMSDGPVSEIWDGPDPPPYFQPVCAPFQPPINCRPQNG